MFDVIVCGLGAHGSAALYELSQIPRLKVLGMDAHDIASPRAGSYGQTRLLRRSYFENESYIPIVTESLNLWKKHESQLKLPIGSLIQETGFLLIASDALSFKTFEKILHCRQKYDLPIYPLSIRETRRCYPAFEIPEDHEILLEKDGSILFCETAIQSFVDAAIQNGAQVSLQERVQNIEIHSQYVQIKTNKSSYKSHKVISSIGAWTPSLFKSFPCEIEIRESPQFWFSELKTPLKIQTPFAILSSKDFVYGFPDFGKGVKIAAYEPGRRIHQPEDKDETSQEGLDLIQRYIKKYLKSLSPISIDHHTCFFDLGPESDIILDFHPESKRVVWIASGSGHSFKMAPSLGLAAVQMALEESYVPGKEFLRTFTSNNPSKLQEAEANASLLSRN